MARRIDSVGFFWADVAKVKAPAKVKVKRDPPQRFWESPDYLPGLEEARNFKPDLFNDIELYQASVNKEELEFDSEIYPNYCLFAFKSIDSGKVVYFECNTLDPFDEDPPLELNIPKLSWVLHNFKIINFNGRKFDFPITTLALAGYGSREMWEATCMLIVEQLQSQDVYKKFKTQRMRMAPEQGPDGKPLPYLNQIDLIELTALGPGLKVCAGRLHAPRMQDLPFKPGTHLNHDQILILRRYCINDLDNTGILYKAVKPQIAIRESQGERYRLDLRSHSDAQMAEAIVSAEIKRITGRMYLSRTKLAPGTKYYFKVPHFIKYQTPLMNHVLDIIRRATFHVDHFTGSVIMPVELAKMTINMNKSTYKIGIGGLHSQEKSVAHVADDEYFIADTDATSYYPRLILNAGLTPSNLGKDFLIVYNGIVVERVSAKQLGFADVAECLKIVVNGTFGKLGSMWSIVYAPDLMIQVTVTGQLSILMLAERFELNGIEVTSVNTDGIVVKCHRAKEDLFKSIVQGWEKDTGFGTEEIRYKATYSKDINNYIAIYEERQKGKLFKTKGAYSETAPKKNAVNEICVDAIKALMEHGTSPATTIRACRDITRFTSMRAVSGGAVHMESMTYLGKVIRWYYAEGEQTEIIYAKNGNKVARTDGAKAIMDLPAEFPTDVNYEWYINETYKILGEIGYNVSDKPTTSDEENEDDEYTAELTEAD